MGFKGMLSRDALVLMALSVRPSSKPITLVGVFSLASFFSCVISFFDQGFPLLRLYLAIMSPFGCMSMPHEHRIANIKGRSGSVRDQMTYLVIINR